MERTLTDRPIPLTELVGLYLLRCDVEGKSVRTVRAYRETLGRFLRDLPSTAVQEPATIRQEHIYAYLGGFTGLALDTRHRYFREVRCFFNWLVAVDYLTSSPFAKLRNVRLPKKIVRPYTLDDVQVLLAACAVTPQGLRDRAILLMLLDTGLRVSELAQLTLDDLDLVAMRRMAPSERSHLAMPRHRGLNLKRFIFNVPFDLFQQYFRQLTVESDPNPTMFVDVKAMESWLDASENREASGVVLEEWGRIFDICVHAGVHLFRAYDRSKLPCDQERPIEELAMRLFLEDQTAFEYAWSYYLLHASQARVSQYRFPAGELAPHPDQVQAMEKYLAGMFEQQKKGGACRVRANKDQSGVIILVSRGAYMRTVMQWQGTRVVFRTFRPAVEDVMTYEPDAERLNVRPGFNRDRSLYVHAIARFLAEDDELADKALADRVFSLERLQNGKFSYKGNDVIRRIALREAHLQLPALGEPTLVIKSDDVTRTLREDLHGVSLSMGELKRVKLLFELQVDVNAKSEPVVFEIEPPGFSDLSLRRHREHVEAYLRAQGVKLV